MEVLKQEEIRQVSGGTDDIPRCGTVPKFPPRWWGLQPDLGGVVLPPARSIGQP